MRIFWPSARHLFGVDPIGRDVFARVLYGARVSLFVAFVATGLSMIVGVTLGMVAGFFRGWVDMGISRVIDLLRRSGRVTGTKTLMVLDRWAR